MTKADKPVDESSAPVADETIVVDINALTLRDIRRVEVAIGRKLGQIFGTGLAGLDAEAMAGVIWVARNKVDPSYTLDDALDTKFVNVAMPDPDEATQDPS